VAVLTVVMFVVVPVWFDRTGSVQKPEMSMWASVGMAVDMVSVPVQYACVGAVHPKIP
jgi:3-deoxy-D-manno-octulosonic acid (KDO) 8-phosphate synthase